MDIPNLTSDVLFPKKELPFFINKYYYKNAANMWIHTHDFIEIDYVCDGKGHHSYNGSTYPVNKGDLYIINPRTPHSFYPTDNANSEHLVVYTLAFLPEFITDSMTDRLPHPEEILYAADLRLSGSMRTEIEQLYEKMYMEFTAKNINYVEILRLSLYELLLKIQRFYKSASEDLNGFESLTDQHRQQLILDCIEYLRNHYSQKITIEELSNHFFLSKSYLSGLFKKMTGSGIVEYLQHIRIEKACELLTSTPLTITEISNMVGYTDYRFFNKSFKKITGSTAHEYRKNPVC